MNVYLVWHTWYTEDEGVEIIDVEAVFGERERAEKYIKEHTDKYDSEYSWDIEERKLS